MSEIVVGIDDSAGADDALAFARLIAGRTRATLRLASAYAYEEWPSRAASHEYGSFLERDAQEILDRHAGDNGAITHAIADPSPARALHRLAERIGAAMIVVGSTHRGALGRVLPGSTGERLLHGAPCPVAIAPRGYAERGARAVQVVGAGYDATDESEAALRAACRIAGRFGARLRVVRVFDATRVGTPALLTTPGYVTVHEDYEELQRAGLERAVASLPDDIDAEARFVAGRPGPELVTQSQDVDLMVIGSRGYGPLAAVLLGGGSHALLVKAACPVVVLPRGVRASMDALFVPDAEAAAP